MRRDDGLDLLLLHPPSVYDFREKSIFYGPVSDVIPSSPVFEMYPLGFLTIVSYLQKHGMSVRVANLAVRMMNEPRFSVPRFLASLHPRAIGIDLHWLPHAHGALEVARVVKEIHPDIPVIMGGLSATYFHKELIGYPQVDFVLRGDSTEPPLLQLLQSFGDRRALSEIPNLTWKDGGSPQVNPMTFLPPSLDYVDLRPDLMVEMVMRYRDRKSVMPFDGWWGNPITAVFTVKGCAYECVTCGSSKTTCAHLTKRTRPVFRSPASLATNVVALSRLTRAPIYLVGDPLQAGADYANEMLSALHEANVPNELGFEFFDLPPLDFLRRIDASVAHWSMEISPESHDHDVRRAQEGEAEYDNAQLEYVLSEALRLRCSEVDVFFMIGLPRQTYQSVLDTISYCEHLFSTSDRRLSCFITPMAPFVDPGSRVFENPEAFGYRLFASSLEEHRQLLLQPSWEGILNYETRWMSRTELVDATYDAAERLNELKLKYGRVTSRRGQQVASRIRAARELRRRLAESQQRGEEPTATDLKGDLSRFSESSASDKRELFWPRHLFNFSLAEIVRVGLRHFRPVGHAGSPAE